MLPRPHLGAAGDGTGHLHLGLHDFGLRRHGRHFGADGVRARLLLPQLDQLLGQNLARVLVARFGHFLNFSFLRGEERQFVSLKPFTRYIKTLAFRVHVDLSMIVCKVN